MPLHSYEDFLDLTVKQLTDYLSVRGLNSSGRIVELVARAFAAMEMKIEIVQSTQEQQKQLVHSYQKKLEELGIPDPKEISVELREDDIRKWPAVTLGHVFSYILKKRDFDSDYIGKYKDKKAYSFFDSGFVGPVLMHSLKSLKKVIFMYCVVRASQNVNEYKSLWIAIQCESSSKVEILSAWCSCMAGAYEACNHIIVTLYKIEYANSKGWCSPACTEVACRWNRSTRKDIEPTRIMDIFVRKRLRSDGDKLGNDREQKRMENLQSFDPRVERDRVFDENRFIEFLERIEEINPNAVILKSVECLSTSVDKQTPTDMEVLSSIVREENPNAEEVELIRIFIEKLGSIKKQTIDFIEGNTREQLSNDLWFKMREGRLTASKHHDIFTKVNSLARSTGLTRP